MLTIQKIMAMICKKLYAIALLGCLVSAPVVAQEYSRKITRSFKVNNSTTVDVFNKYGKIHIITWDKDSVRFDIDLRIKASNDSRLNKLKNNIDFDFTGTEYYVIAKTRIGSGTSGILSDLADIAGSIMPSDNRVTIDYVIMMPTHINLKLNNKFGDVYIDDLNGNLNLSLSNGELKANELSGNTVINLSSGGGVLNSIKEGKVTVSYSNLHIKNIDNLSVDSRSSTVNIEKANFLKLVSRRDKYFIQEISDLYGDSYFSDLNVLKLSGELNYSLKYGNLSIQSIERGFSFIQINSEYTDVNLIFGRGLTYEIDIMHHFDVILNYPRQLANLQTKEISKEDKQNLIYGKIGSGITSSKVKINAPRKCTINIVHK